MQSPPLLSTAARRLEGKVAIITGGASGIGESSARLFCRHGAKVIIADIQDDLGRFLCEELGPSSTSFVHCDVTQEADIQKVVDTAVSMHGKLDIMFNNAGIAGNSKMSIFEADRATFEKVFNVNVIGAFLGTKHAARVMAPARQGCIVNTASVVSIVAGMGPCAYTCSKHAVVGLTKSAAVELGQYGIRVNCVSPYGVKTRMTKALLQMEDVVFDKAMGGFACLQGANLSADDIAEAAMYLASEESKYVTGHNLIVDGGFSVFNSTFTHMMQNSVQ
ncbi:borneol dehydrogenase, mitochondrial-like [Aristolochia californica]|uniref:borneol dehydrogenase, mitochondrial-like n=1 Tax=Aristolochia californica TaxID=171875 RepID=UPI0035DFF94A